MPEKIMFNADAIDVVNCYLNNRDNSILTIDIERDKIISEIRKLVPISTMFLKDIEEMDKHIDYCCFNDLHCNYNQYDVIFINAEYNEMIYQLLRTYYSNE